MSNIIIGMLNRVDAATLSGGNWTATLPQANLKNRLIAKAARTSGDAIADATINVDLGDSYAVGVVALVAHNISVAGKVRVQVNSSSTFTSPLYSSGWVDVWPAGVIPTGLTEWERDNFWLGTLSASDRAGFQAPYVNLDTGRTVGRYLRIEVDDTTNASGYISIGRLYIGDYWSPTINYAYGAAISHEDETTIIKTVGGQEYFDAAGRYRVMSFRLEFMSETEAYTRALELQRLHGLSGEVLIVADPADATNGIRRNFLGRMRSISKILHASNGSFAMDIDVRESL